MAPHQPTSRAVQTVKAFQVDRSTPTTRGHLTLKSPYPISHSAQHSRAVAVAPRWGLLTPILALDGEFQRVYVDKLGKQIHRAGRLTLVNSRLEPVYDVFAYWPEEEGMQKRLSPARLKLGVYWWDIKLKNGARPIEEVMENLKELKKVCKIVGHAIDNDIKIFPRGLFDGVEVRDTQLLEKYREYATGRDRKPGLATLSREVLGREIQGEEHSSLEDAIATMELYLLEKEAFEVGQAGWRVTAGSR